MDLSNLNKNKPKKPPTVDMSSMVYGKVPPNYKEAEKDVLGAILNEKYALGLVQDILTPEKFYLEGHQQTYQAMLNLDLKSQPVDLTTVAAELLRMEALDVAGGAFALVGMSRGVTSSAHIESHARLIHQAWMKREAIRVGGEMITGGYDSSVDPFDLVDSAEAGVAGIMNSSERGKVTTIDTAVAHAIQRIYKLRELGSSITGIPAGFTRLDEITHGWQDTDLIILAARPAVGKTAFALNLARNAALGPKPTAVAFFSLEMSRQQLTERLLSAETGIAVELIKTGRLDDSQIKFMMDNGAARLAASNIFIDDTPALNILELRAKSRRLKNKHNLGFIIVDYLQLMSGTAKRGGNREQDISEISRNLKGLAKELEVPIIALSQLSRGVEGRNDKTPQLSDLRESGAIEQDADTVMFLYRPEYYGITADENGNSTRGETHVKIAKHRHGSLDTIKLTAKLDIQKFVEYEGESYSPPDPGKSWRPVATPYKDNLDF